MRFVWKTVAQVIFFIVLSWIMNLLVQLLHLPVPGSIAGMLVLFLLLRLKLIPRTFVEAGSDWLIATMLLFFIPPAVGIISYRQLLVDEGLQMALLIAIGTIIVMVCSGLIAQRIARRKECRPS